jgi:hypothetical protein
MVEGVYTVLRLHRILMLRFNNLMLTEKDDIMMKNIGAPHVYMSTGKLPLILIADD